MALLGELSYALIQPSARAIGTIFADVTIEENHRDEVIITQHPVEGGGVIADHAYKRPAELEIRCGFSNSSAGYVGYVQEQYEALLALQLARKPFDVYTGKRRYKNMLIRGLGVVTDPHTENVLMATVALQEIVIVSTQQGGGGASGGGDTAAPGASGDQAEPASTGAISNLGSVDGIGQESQSFAGAFNPGAYSPDGSSVAGYTFGLNETSPGQPISTNIAGNPIATPAPITANFADLPTVSQLDGLAPPPPVGDGVMTVSDPATGKVLVERQGLSVTTAKPLNIFGSGKASR